MKVLYDIYKLFVSFFLLAFFARSTSAFSSINHTLSYSRVWFLVSNFRALLYTDEMDSLMCNLRMRR